MNSAILFIYIACSAMILYASPESLVPTILDGTENTIKFLPVLFGTYCLWIPITKILEKSGVDKGLSRLLTPINKRLFPAESDECYKHLSVNVSSNLLGMGGAATPSGIAAMGSMSSKKNKIMLTVINSLSLQLIPTTVVAMRAARGGTVDIVLPSLAASAVTSLLGIILVKALVKK